MTSLDMPTSTSSPRGQSSSADSIFDTGPPAETTTPAPTALRRLKASALGKVSAFMLPLIQRAARSHVGGETIDDALCVARRLADEKTPSTIGFWDTADYSGRQVADIYLTAIEQLAASGLDSYVSIKPPALRFDSGLAAELAAAAQASRIRLHCDSHGPEVADPSHAMEQTMLEHLGAGSLSTTLPGRWSRSLSDADWAIERGLSVRVVKGQWPDPTDPKRDMRAGYLEVIDRLAGRVRHVGVASHDLSLAAEAIARLRAAGTSCELELLFGRPMAQSLRWARDNAVGVRIYVPFGKGYIPSAIGLLKHNPRLALRIISNIVTETVER